VANIDAFQGKVNSWVLDADLKRRVTDGVRLFRAWYIHENPLPGKGN